MALLPRQNACKGRDLLRRMTLALAVSLLCLLFSGCAAQEDTSGDTSGASGSGSMAQDSSDARTPDAGRTGSGTVDADDEQESGEGESEEEDGTFRAVFLDVGKGDCILLSTQGKTMMVDTGYEDTADDVLDALETYGIESLQAMVITHYDKDHVGGAAQIAEQIPVGTFYLPGYTGEEDKCGDLLELIEMEGLHAVSVTEDLCFSLGDASICVDAGLVPFDAEEKNDNDASLIVTAAYGEDSWLLPGDIEKPAMEVWLSERARHYDILKMPHHGRKEDNTAAFIKAVSPAIAVITDSNDDEASEKVLKKLDKNGAAVFRSSLNGTIKITGYGIGKYDVKTE